jgi:hypothetical protein
MKKQSIFCILLAAVGCFISQASAHQVEVEEEKIYVSLNQINLTPEGIFYLDQQGDYQRVKMLSHDDGGIYVVKYIGCFICSVWSTDGTIHKSWCPYYVEGK